MTNRLVSIITPSYKSEEFIAQTIDTVLAQTYDNWEMIIIDDCSPDNANAIIEKYCNIDKRIQLIKLENNSGSAVARNTGIELAKGKYIAFLDADDLWLSEKLSKQISFMETNQLVFSYASYYIIDESSNALGTFNTKKSITYASMLKTSSVGCLTAMYDAEKLGKMYMPLIRRRQDYGLWLNILKRIPSTEGLLEPLASYRISKNSLSSNKFKTALYQWKIYRKFEKLSFLKSLYYFINYMFYGIIKYR